MSTDWIESGKLISLAWTLVVASGIYVVLHYLEHKFESPLPRSSPKPKPGTRLADPRQNASLLSKILYSWQTPLLQLGYKKNGLVDSDLPELQHELTAAANFAKFDYFWSHELQTGNKRVYMAILKTFGPFYAKGEILQFVNIAAGYVTPLLLESFITFIKSRPKNDHETYTYFGIPDSVLNGLILAVTLFLVTEIRSISSIHYFHYKTVTSHQLRNAIILSLYAKVLRLPLSSLNASAVASYFSVDAENLRSSCLRLHVLWADPLEVILALYMLYSTLGWSILAGVAVILIFHPINKYINDAKENVKEERTKQFDERIKLEKEVFAGIKMIKLWVWGKFFESRVTAIWSKELSHATLSRTLQSFERFSTSGQTVLVGLVTLIVYTFTNPDKSLDVSKVFATLWMFDLLKSTLPAIPSDYSIVRSSMFSLNRIISFLLLPETPKFVTVDPTLSDLISFSVKNGSIGWKSNEYVLKNINIDFAKGKTTGIIGSVGVGKSTLLCLLMGEAEIVEGSVKVGKNHSLAYVSQQAWIAEGTIKENILFGLPYDENRYQSAITACALEPDLRILPNGDMTLVGEKGFTLSGGQKQRIALARAVYADKDIYLLDDPLSSVDSHVDRHIFSNVIHPKTGLLKGKTVILSLNGLHHLQELDSIIYLKDGGIQEAGSYFELRDKKGEVFSLLEKYVSENSSDADTFEIITNSEINANDNEVKESKEDKEDKKDTMSTSTNPTKVFTMSYWDAFLAFVRRVGIHGFVLYIILLILNELSQMAIQFWLQYWSGLDLKTQREGRNRLAGVYFTLSLLTIAMGLIVPLIWRRDLALKVVKAYHEQLYERVTKAPMSFIETTPMGAIMNRFNTDLATVEGSLPDNINGFLLYSFKTIMVVLICSYATPAFIVASTPLLLLFYNYWNYYGPSNSSLAQLNRTSWAKINHIAQASISGVQTIRVFEAEKHFTELLEAQIDETFRAYYNYVSSNRWLDIRMEGTISVFILFLTVISALSKDDVMVSIVGLALIYTINLRVPSIWVIRGLCDLQSDLLAISNIEEICQLKPEGSYEILTSKPIETWPQKGKIVFQKYSTSYRSDLDDVLKNVSFTVPPSSILGIIGRTGAGKSSLLQGLSRLIEPTGGTIFIDDIDISKLALHDLRSKITVIPQDPVFFATSLRSNLDPYSDSSEDELWKALDAVGMKEHVENMENGLDVLVQQGGLNFSLGQRQLLCLARAVLRKPQSRILLLDESTAAIDIKTDEMIQATIRKLFRHCTIIIIAHRIKTVLDVDRVLVMADGKVAEFDTPKALLENPESSFYGFVKQAGLA